MNRTWKKIAALAAAAALGVPASAELTTGRIGNIFTTGDEVRFHCTDAGTPAPEFEVRNWRQETVRSGTLSAEIRLDGLPPATTPSAPVRSGRRSPSSPIRRNSAGARRAFTGSIRP